MQHPQREQLFNDWAQHYGDTVASNDTFPFEGYSQVLDEIIRLADVKVPLQVRLRLASVPALAQIA